jgi:hypothetical protein
VPHQFNGARIWTHTGYTWATDINGDEADVRAYFRIGAEINVGAGPDDRMERIVAVAFWRHGEAPIPADYLPPSFFTEST